MKRSLLTTLFWILSTCIPAFSQPTNDLFENALEVSGTYIEGRVVLTTATSEAGEPLIASDFDHTTWYRWIAPETGAASFNAIGNSGKQVSAAIYFGYWPELRLVNYAVRTPSASLRFPVAKGQVIFSGWERTQSLFDHASGVGNLVRISADNRIGSGWYLGRKPCDRGERFLQQPRRPRGRVVEWNQLSVVG